MNSLTYRTDTCLWGVAEFLGTLVFLFIWMMLFGEKDAIGGFTLPETITYLIGVGIIADTLHTHAGTDIAKDVQTGNLSSILLKPLKYSSARGIREIAGKPIYLAIRLVVYGGVAIFFREKFILSQDFLVWLLFFSSFCLAYLINFLTDFLFGCLSFWTTTTRGSSGILRTVRSIFSGGYAPLTFFPPLFQTVASLLPFAYTRYFPMLIYLGKVDTMGIAKGLLVQVFWVGALLFLTKKIWQKGLRRYEGVGI